MLLKGGAAAQHARYHDDGSGHDQYVGGGSVRLGGEQADVVALLHQGPDAHRQHDAPCQLEVGAHQESRVSQGDKCGRDKGGLKTALFGREIKMMILRKLVWHNFNNK